MISGLRFSNETPTKKLISKLISSELNVEYDLAKEISTRKDAVPFLIKILKSEKYWRIGSPGNGWTWIHALHLLGAIGDERGLDFILDFLRETPDDFGDWLTEDVPSVLANFGQQSFEKLVDFVKEKGLDPWVRSAGSRALVVIAMKNPEYKDTVISLFKKIIESENNPDYITLLVDELVEFQDPESLDVINSAFDRNLVNTRFIDRKGIQEIYNDPDERLHYHFDDRDPLAHFKFDRIQKLSNWEKSEESRKKKKKLTIPKKEKRMRRNDPCPCGSGKKYKKCCLKR